MLGLVAMLPSVSSADHWGQSVKANGLVAYMGITPAEVIRKHPDQYPQHARDEVPSGKNEYHVLLALFDSSSGERIIDADIEVRVFPIGLAGVKKHLYPMSVAGEITYCNFFEMSPTDVYVIRAQVHRPGRTRAVEAEFVLRPHRG